MKNKKSTALWGGRFSESASSLMLEIGQSIDYDKILYEQDIIASIAHVRMLAGSSVLTEKQKDSIVSGLKQIYTEIKNDNFVYDYAKEDIHMHIESRLIEIIGEDGKKMHTARSRNDQISVDVHLYLKKKILELAEFHISLLKDLLRQAEENTDVIFPAYTHLQIAQPIRLAHYFLAYFWKFARDFSLLNQAYLSSDVLTLGSGALAGVNYKNDRKYLAELLHFSAVSENSMDAVSERDYQMDFLYYTARLFVHSSRFAEECIIYSSAEFSLFSLSDNITTGSSIMPQKKNPDLAELLRGKSARGISALNRAFLLQKSLPMTYNRDLQEDKENLFDSIEQSYFALEGTRALLNGIKVNPENAKHSLEKGFATATDLADALVSQKGISFREAHHITGALVGELAKKNLLLSQADGALRERIHPFLKDDDFYFSAISLEKSADKKISEGGTALPVLKDQLKKAEDKLRVLEDNKRNWSAVPTLEEILS